MELGRVTGYILGAAVIIMGVVSYYVSFLDSPLKEALSILFIVYGLWRIYRAYKM
jgi:sulfite exporter TauE/SafE